MLVMNRLKRRILVDKELLWSDLYPIIEILSRFDIIRHIYYLFQKKNFLLNERLA